MSSILKQLEEMLHFKRSKDFYAKKLNISVEEVTLLIKEIKNKDTQEEVEDFKRTVGFVEDIKNNRAETVFESPEKIKNLQDLIEKSGIDTEVWQITKWIQNFWGNEKNPHWQVKVWLEPKQKRVEDIIDTLLTNYKTPYKLIKESEILKNSHYNSPSCLLLSLPDVHIDKLTVSKTSIEEKVNSYKQVLDCLLYRSYKAHFIEEIVFVIGNDLFQTDTFFGQTTKGTKVDADMTYDEAYEVGFDLMVWAISKLRQFCNKLHIVLVQGNHPKTKEFYLTHALQAYFKVDNNIYFNRAAKEFKVHKYGETLLCFNHGNNVNDRLPLIFATEFYKEWGECKYKDVLLGDKHHNNEKLFRTQGEQNGVRMRILPSLGGTDRWHTDNLFVGALQAGIALIYDKEKGKISEFEERV